jgi:hypothetical protein
MYTPKAKQPRDVAKNKMGLEPQFSGHLIFNRLLVHAAARLALQSLRPTTAAQLAQR